MAHLSLGGLMAFLRIHKTSTESQKKKKKKKKKKKN